MKGEIWLVDLPSSNGHEQSGLRPIILFFESKANVSIIVPLTSNVQSLRFPFTLEINPSAENGLEAISIALAFQIRAIDKKRLIKKIGFLEEDYLSTLNNLLKK